MSIHLKKHSQSLDRTSAGSTALYSQIVSRIKQWVRDGDLKEGDVLPSERELAEIFGVSRVPVREALKSLQLMGIVTSVRGKGVMVRRSPVEEVINNFDILINPVAQLHDLFDVRDAIEVLAAGLAAQRRSQEDLELMEEGLVETELEILRDRPVRQASMKFHSALIGASHNEIVMRINEMLHALLMHSRQETLRTRKQRLNALADHRRILEAIRKQNVEEARKRMLDHLNSVRKTLPAMAASALPAQQR